MTTTIEIPTFDFTAFYYPQVLEALMAFKRVNVKEHTNESPQDALIQTLRAYACVAHLCNTNLDTLANENTLRTAKLPETVRDMLQLIDYNLASASPSVADLLCKLSGPLTTNTLVVPAYSQVSTRKTLDLPAIVFEVLEDKTSPASDLGAIGAVFAYDSVGDAYTDYTTEGNDGSGFEPWTSAVAGQKLYIGHEELLWLKTGIEILTAGAGLTGVWEHYHGAVVDMHPDYKRIDGVQLTFVVNGLLGLSDRSGAMIRVQRDQTGVYEEVESQWGTVTGVSGTVNYITTTSLLGDTIDEAGTTVAEDYSIGAEWKELGFTDGSSNFQSSGDLEIVLPESATRSWETTLINGETLYWLRYRVISVSTPTVPEIGQLRIDEGDQFAKVVATQGRRQQDLNLGLADGVTPSQQFTTTKDGFIDGSDSVDVDSIAWTRVSTFLQSSAVARHYLVDLGANDRATIVFGNGLNGAIPSGQVDVVYRYGVQDNGNVGAETIVVDKSGLAYVTSIRNPRVAVGWQEADAASEQSLELAKVLGPASIRTSEVALGPEDVESMTLAYRDPDTNVRPFIRAKALEGTYGPKTIELVVVPSGGGAAPIELLDVITLYFNGDAYAIPPVRKRIVANQEVVTINYSQYTVNISATIYGATSIEAVADALEALLQPGTRKADGVTFEWLFGQVVYRSRILHEIHSVDSAIYNIGDLLLNGGTGNLTPGPRQLPVAGSIVLTEGT
jgi:hypothetical protein